MPKRVLIIDDEPDLVELMESEIRTLGVETLTAFDGAKGLQIIKAEKPDLILSDLNMPGVDGMEMLRILQENKIDTPVIFVTGFGDKEVMRQASVLGNFDFIEKPVDLEYLLHAVKTGLEFGFAEKKANFMKGQFVSQLTLEVPKELHEKLKIFCEQNNRSVTSFVVEAIQDKILKEKK